MIAKFDGILSAPGFEVTDWRIWCASGLDKEYFYTNANGVVCNSAIGHASEARFLSTTGVWSQKR